MSERKSLIPEYGPFAGMRIIDTGSLVAMPFAATLLADFGAEVIHIERPGVGDTLRVLAPFAKEDGKTVSTSWAQDGRNKLSLSLELNLKHPEVKELFYGPDQGSRRIHGEHGMASKSSASATRICLQSIPV